MADSTGSSPFLPLPLFFLLLTACDSGVLIGFPSDAKGDVGATLAAADIASLMNGRLEMPSSGKRISVEELDVLLDSSSPTDRSFHLRFDLLELKHLHRSRSSTSSFLKSRFRNLPPHINISSIVVDSNGIMEPSFLPTMHSFCHALTSIRLHRRVKVAPIFSLSRLDNLCRSHVKDLRALIKYVRKFDSYLVVEIPPDGELGCEDCLGQFLLQKLSYVHPILSEMGIPVIPKVQVSAVSECGKLATSLSKVVRSLMSNSQKKNKIHEVFVEIPMKLDSGARKGRWGDEILPSSHRLLLLRQKEHDTSRTTARDLATPVTNPAVTPSTPSGLITVPSTDPVTVLPTNPMIPSVTVPSTLPPPLVPVTNPVATPIDSGQSWCVAKPGASDSALQNALDYACGMGGVDCSPIQETGPCYNPNTLADHASYAFNSYYLKNPTSRSCDFGGTATLVNTNPNICANSVPTPTTVPATNPTNPVIAPPTTLPPPLVPVTNPAVIPPPPPNINPITDPLPPPSGIVGGTAQGTVPVSPGNGAQIWCVAKKGALDAALETALSYACGIGGSDCSAIQRTGNCYIPNTLHDHASYAFNSYYQKNPNPASCDFGGTAMLINTDPSSGTCTYPTSSTSSPAFGTGAVPGDGTSTTVFGSSNPIVSNSSITSGTGINGKSFSRIRIQTVLLSLVLTSIA